MEEDILENIRRMGAYTTPSPFSRRRRKWDGERDGCCALWFSIQMNDITTQNGDTLRYNGS